MHGLGVTEALGQGIPEVLLPIFVFVTQLGDPWFFFVVLAVVYWFGDRAPGLAGGIDRRRAAFVLGLAVGSFALITLLKNGFVLHRPPGAAQASGSDLVPAFAREAYVWAATADGYGFPSGHALGATVVWGGLASVLGVPSRVQRLVAASVIVGLVGLSRLVLGVHHLLDVVVGVLVGLVYLAVALRVGGRSPERAFWLAGTLGLVALGVEVTPDAVALLGAALSGAAVWYLVGPRVPDRPRSRTVGAVTATVGVPLVGGLFLATYAFELWLPLEALGGAAAVALLLTLPLVGEYVGGEVASARRGTPDTPSERSRNRD